MRKLMILFFIFISALTIEAQETNRKYICWFLPSNADIIYGVGLNFSAEEDNLSRHFEIDGIHIQSNPFLLIAIPSGLFASISTFGRLDLYEPRDMSHNFVVNGISLSLQDFGISRVNGLDVNLILSGVSVVNGITLSGLMNRQYMVNGITFSLTGNKNYECNGIQIGILNYCESLHGFQFGLWNINQKRSFPFINWCFANGKRHR